MKLCLHIAFFMLFIIACMSCKHEQVTNAIILEHGYYFDGDTMQAFEELVIQEGKIAFVGKGKSDVTGKHINLQGRYVIPGLTDAHVHLAGSPTKPYVMIQPEYNAASSLRCGVTTVIDLFFEEGECKKFKIETNSWPGKYATVLLSGPILTAPEGHGTEYGVPTRTITSVDEAERITQEVIDNGVDVIKLVYEAYSGKHAIGKDMLQVIVKVAHANGVKVFAHVNVAKEAMDCIDADVDVLAHIPYDTLTIAHLKRIKESGILTIPTISVFKSFYEGHNAGYMSDSLLLKTAHPSYLSKFKKGELVSPIYYNYKQVALGARHNLKQLIKYKLPIAAGTDAGNYAVFYGYSLHDELYQYVLEGMPPAEALNSATSNIYSVLPEHKTGMIKEGYDADLVILDKNPLTDIRYTKSIFSVYHAGIEVNLQLQ